MAKYATIDVGTNSVLIHIAEKDENGNLKGITDRTEISRLGEGLRDTGNLKPEAMERTAKALSEFVDLAKQHNVEGIAAIGTMCLREAKNSDEFIKKVKDLCGLQIEVIPGEEEARLSYLAVKSGAGIESEKELLIFDVGGGSTEFIFGKGDEITRRFSLNIGAIRFTEDYFLSDPVTEEEFQNGINAVKEAFADADFSGTADYLIGMGGTITNLAAIKHKLAKYDPNIIQGSKLTLADVTEQMEHFRSIPLEERKKIPGLQPKRADVILAGATIVSVVMEKIGLNELTVSDRGIRHGLMFDRFGK